jgi:hypothetical protein
MVGDVVEIDAVTLRRTVHAVVTKGVVPTAARLGKAVEGAHVVRDERELRDLVVLEQVVEAVKKDARMRAVMDGVVANAP